MIHAKNLTYRYPAAQTSALEDVTFELPKGAFGIVEGGGGSGKSTLAKLLFATQCPTSGELEVLGYDLLKLRDVPLYRRSVGFVSAQIELIDERSVAENIELPLELADVKAQRRKERLVELLHRFGLEYVKKALPSALSEGERRRTQLARALANEPVLLILDEPTLGLDPAVSSAIWDLLFREHQRGMTILALVNRLPDDTRFGSCQRIDLRPLS